jgi:hypothetical protein
VEEELGIGQGGMVRGSAPASGGKDGGKRDVVAGLC